MWVWNLRLFLTAVTQTVDKPTTVILWNKVISNQFRHLGISQMMNDDSCVYEYLYNFYLGTSEFVNLCFCVLVLLYLCIYLYTCILVYLFIRELVNRLFCTSSCIFVYLDNCVFVYLFTRVIVYLCTCINVYFCTCVLVYLCLLFML